MRRTGPAIQRVVGTERDGGALLVDAPCVARRLSTAPRCSVPRSPRGGREPRERDARPVTSRGLARAAAGIVIATVIAVSGVVAWSVLRRPVLDAAVPLPEGPRLGDMAGYVGRVDAAAQTIAIADDPGGARFVDFHVTPDTSIRIRGRDAGLEDLSKDMPARAYYEVHGGVKYLTALDVPDDDRAAAERPAAETAANTPAGRMAADAKPPTSDGKAAADAKPPTSDARPTAEIKSPTIGGRPPSQRAALPNPLAAPSSPPAVAPAATARIAPGARPGAASAARPADPSAAPATDDSRIVSSRAPETAPADAALNDGTAAVDWLFQQSRRR